MLVPRCCMRPAEELVDFIRVRVRSTKDTVGKWYCPVDSPSRQTRPSEHVTSSDVLRVVKETILLMYVKLSCIWCVA